MVMNETCSVMMIRTITAATCKFWFISASTLSTLDIFPCNIKCFRFEKKTKKADAQFINCSVHYRFEYAG